MMMNATGKAEHLVVVVQQRAQRDEGECPADRIDNEPAEARRQPAERRRKEVPEIPERRPAFDHLWDAESRAHRREDGVGDRAHEGTDDAAENGGPESAAERGDRQDPDEDGRELHIRGHPGPEELDRIAVALAFRNVLDAAWLDGGDTAAVFPFAYRYVARRPRSLLPQSSPLTRVVARLPSEIVCSFTLRHQRNLSA